MTTIIAFAGRKQSGKTTSSEFLTSVIDKYGLGTYKIYNFADTLKQDICINILGLTYDQCYGDDHMKNSLTDIKWENLPGYDPSWNLNEEFDSSGFLTARQVMQIIGTDIFRKLKRNVWAEATLNKIKNENYDFAIIADCRFPNEVDAVRSANGYVIKLTLNPHNSTHLSEVSLDPDKYSPDNFDLIINNDDMSLSNKNDAIIRFLQDKGMILL
jgi:hypothetical protein